MKINIKGHSHTPSLYIVLGLITYAILAIPAIDGPLVLDSTKLYGHYDYAMEYGFKAFFDPLEGLRRALSFSTFYVQFFFDQELNVSHLKLFNTVLHCIIGILVYFTVKKFLDFSGYRKKQESTVAVTCCLLWLLSPANTTSTFYTIQRLAQLSAFFQLSSIYLYLQFRIAPSEKLKILYLSLFIALALISPLTKENAILILPIVLLIESFNSRSTERLRKLSLLASTLITIAIPIGIFLVLNDSLNYANKPYTLTERFLTQFNVLSSYLAKLVLPANISTELYNDGYPLSKSIFESTQTSISILFHLLAIALASYLSLKRNLLGFGILFYYITHSLESTLLPIELFFIHRNYLPSLGIYFFISLAVLLIATKYRVLRIAKITLVTYLCFFTSISAFKASTWSNKEKLILTERQIYPNSPRILSEHAQLMFEKGDVRQSLADLRRLESISAFNKFRVNIQKIFYLCLRGHPIPEEQYNRLDNINSLGINNEYSQSLSNLLSIYEKKQCKTLDPQRLVEILVRKSSLNTASPEHLWTTHYHIAAFSYASGEHDFAKEWLQDLHQNGEEKAGHMLDFILKSEDQNSQNNEHL